MIKQTVCDILTEILGLDRTKTRLTADTALLGHLPEFDSMAVVSILNAIEDHFGISVDDDEVDASLFESVATLTAFVESKTATQ